MDSPVLDRLDQKIVQALCLDPRAPYSRLSLAVGASEQTVARRYRRMSDRRLVRVVGQIDSQRLGRSDWAVRIRCAPGVAPAVADRLAEHPDTSWVQLLSGGTEVFSIVRSHPDDHRTPLLLGQLSVGRHVVALEAYRLLHLFAVGITVPPGSNDLSPSEMAHLAPVAPLRPVDRSTVSLGEPDRPLVEALAADGRASWRQLAERTHWHESTVRRRVEELTASGALSFDVDIDRDAVGDRSRALLWMSVAPVELDRVGRALAARPEIPFVAATTGSTNLLVALIFRDDRALYELLTGDLAALEGVTHVETAPVMRQVKLHATIAPPRP